MTSKSFSYAKTLCCDCKQTVKYLKQSRARKDRRLIRQILKTNPYAQNLPLLIKKNNGAWELI